MRVTLSAQVKQNLALILSFSVLVGIFYAWRQYAGNEGNAEVPHSHLAQTPPISDYPLVPAASLEKSSLKVIFYTTGMNPPYLKFAVQLAKSIDKHFCKNYRKIVTIKMMVFTDLPEEAPKLDPPSFVSFKKVEKLKWPRSSESRFDFMLNSSTEISLSTADFAFWLDADNELSHDFCFDIFGTRVATTHGGFTSSGQAFEGNSNSKAYVPASHLAQLPYISAHLFGGTGAEMIQMSENLKESQLIDRNNGIQAAWDDESHLNRYFMDFPPTVVLPRAFVYPGPDYGHYKAGNKDKIKEQLKNEVPMIVAIVNNEKVRD